MTAVPISRQVVDGDAVLADSQCTCIFQSSYEWYFINFVGKFGIHSGMLFELPLKKKHKAVKTHHHEGFFYFYQNITPMHLVLQSMYVVLVLAKKVVKDCCLPPMDTSWAGMGPGYYQQTFKNHGYLLPAKFWWNSLCNFGEVAEFVI